MSIFDRLGSVINSHMNDFARETNSRFKKPLNYNRDNYSQSDPDLDAAYEELNDFLNNKEPRSEYSRKDAKANTERKKMPPEELRIDFELLKVSFGADEETCKAAYKKLLKIHHPDRHVGHQANLKKATKKMAEINAAWDRIEKYHRGED